MFHCRLCCRHTIHKHCWSEDTGYNCWSSIIFKLHVQFHITLWLPQILLQQLVARSLLDNKLFEKNGGSSGALDELQPASSPTPIALQLALTSPCSPKKQRTKCLKLHKEEEMDSLSKPQNTMKLCQRPSLDDIASFTSSQLQLCTWHYILTAICLTEIIWSIVDIAIIIEQLILRELNITF